MKEIRLKISDLFDIDPQTGDRPKGLGSITAYVLKHYAFLPLPHCKEAQSQIYAWDGLAPDVYLNSTTERMPSEQKWYALTGRVVDAKVEADGDIHIALVDATGNNAGTVSAEIPRASKSGTGYRRRPNAGPDHPQKNDPH